MKGLMFATAFVCCFLLSAHAGETESFTFDGAENLKEILLKKDFFETRYRTESYNSTCSRQVVDGSREECRDVTRQNCTTIPRTCSTSYRQECHTNPPICHTIPRTCHTVPQTCHTVPRTCHTVPQTCRHVCHQTPPACRNVCHSGPQGQICRQVCSAGTQQCSQQCSGGGQSCSGGGQTCSGGGQTCSGGGQSCSGGGQVCHSVPYETCSGGGQSCTPYQERVCGQVPTYHSETYACIETRQVPYQALDHSLDAKVVMNFAEVTANVGAHENFTVAINEDGVALALDASKKLLVFADKNQTVDANGTSKTFNTTINVDFMNIADINSAVKNGIADVSINSNVLFFSLGAFDSKLKFKHSIKLVQKKLFGKDKEILNKEIDSSLFEVSNLNGKKLFALNLAKLNLKLKDKKHEVSINSEVTMDNKKPLNASDIPLLKVVKEIEIKL